MKSLEHYQVHLKLILQLLLQLNWLQSLSVSLLQSFSSWSL